MTIIRSYPENLGFNPNTPNIYTVFFGDGDYGLDYYEKNGEECKKIDFDRALVDRYVEFIYDALSVVLNENSEKYLLKDVVKFELIERVANGQSIELKKDIGNECLEVLELLQSLCANFDREHVSAIIKDFLNKICLEEKSVKEGKCLEKIKS